VVTRDREEEIESLSARSPLVEYDPGVAELWESGRRARTASVACFVVAGAAAVTALAIWAWPRSEARSTLARSLRLRGAGLALDLP
jgi:hypothetical protein